VAHPPPHTAIIGMSTHRVDGPSESWAPVGARPGTASRGRECRGRGLPGDCGAGVRGTEVPGRRCRQPGGPWGGGAPCQLMPHLQHWAVVPIRRPDGARSIHQCHPS
jgi:hypothetical protein